MRTRLKVCCISSVDEAELAISIGVDALGLVSHMPSGPGVIDDDAIAEITRQVPPPIATFLLTSETTPDAVVDHVRRTGVNTVQLVDDGVPPDVWHAVRHQLPAVRIVQVIHVVDEGCIEPALHAASIVDALLLDSGNPDAPVRVLGGTGRVHNWELSRRIVEASPVPVFLAGGINAANVADAIRAVRPFGVDLCSGVRSSGSLDGAKLHALVRSMHATERG